jgi:hypothetical protein
MNEPFRLCSCGGGILQFIACVASMLNRKGLTQYEVVVV